MKQKTFKQRQKAPNNFRLTKQEVQITPNFSNKHLLKGGGVTYWIQALKRRLRLLNFRKFVSELASKSVLDLRYWKKIIHSNYFLSDEPRKPL